MEWFVFFNIQNHKDRTRASKQLSNDLVYDFRIRCPIQFLNNTAGKICYNTINYHTKFNCMY